MNRAIRQVRIKPAKHRTGATLLDVAVGSMLLAIVLIPAVRIVRQNESMQRRVALREAMMHEAENLIESQKIWLADSANFDAVLPRPTGLTRSVRIELPDGPELLGNASIVRDLRYGLGVELLQITVEVGRDQNGNGRLESDEPRETLSTHKARS